MNQNDIVTSPPQRYRAVHKETGKEYRVVQLYWDRLGRLASIEILTGVLGKTRRLVKATNYHIDQSTGHYDAEKREVFGGDVRFVNWPSNGFYVVTGWESRRKSIDFVEAWYSYPLDDSICDRPYPISNDIFLSKVIGNIHNPEALPEEVRRMCDDLDS
jgi:hypothetical protein